MNKKTGYFLLAAAVAIIIAFVARQRTLSELRAGNASLHHQLDARAVTTESESGTGSHSTNSVAQLSPDERTELLRLRGQILPLRRELHDASNRVALLSQPRRLAPVPTAEMSHERQARMQATRAFMQSEPFRSATSLADALQEYLKTHAGEVPSDLAQAEASARSPVPGGVSDRFELMRSGTVPEEARSYTFIAREKEPRRSPDGKWVRIYLLANGGAAIGGPEDESDWPAWERLQEAARKQLARKEQRDKQP